MPELPEVETVRQDLKRLTCQDPIRWVEVHLERTIAHPNPEQFCHYLVGCQFLDWSRRGKYLLGQCDQGLQLGVHLRMTGQLLWQDPQLPSPTHTRVRFRMTSGAELRFVDQRTFGQMWLVKPDQSAESVISGLAVLGPEPLGPGFSVVYFHQALSKSLRPIKNALLDQRLVAGVGNIYADEALFMSRIHPQTPCRHLAPEQVDRLRSQLIEVLTTSIQQRGTSFSHYRDATGVNGNYLGQAWVYRRTGQSCRVCGTTIERLKLAGRSSHYCPNCQPL